MNVVDFSKYYNPKSKQAIAHACRASFLLFGGAMGGGKSWWLCAEAIKNVMKFPGNRLVIVRKELTVLRRTILVTFRAICPPEIIANFNQSTLEVTFINGSVLTFIEANQSKDPLLQKLKGLEIGWFGIDEANEVTEEVYKILRTRLRWILPDGSKPRYEGRLTSNPEPCWLIPVFINSDASDEMYIQSLTTDNYDEDDEYLLQLKRAFKDSPNLMRKYLQGDWTLVDSINQLISNTAIKACEEKINLEYNNAMGVDVARFGDDKTVFTIILNGNVEHIESYRETSINEVVTRAIALMEEYKIEAEHVGVDSVGIGAGVVDNLKAMGYNVLEIQGGAKPEEKDQEEAFKPFNLRAQIYYQLKKDIEIGNLGNIVNGQLKQELPAIKYEIVSDKTVKILDKAALKKILGYSPDFADSLAYANWARHNPIQRFFPLPFIGGFGDDHDDFDWKKYFF
jgi:phage terminase large subunit